MENFQNINNRGGGGINVGGGNFDINKSYELGLSMAKYGNSSTLMTQAASGRCYVNIGVLRIRFLNSICRNVWSKSLKNTCEKVHF